MSTNRVCQICYREESVRYNFGNDFEAENEFHMRTWCDCGYSSGEEMMLDQDLGFSDNRWVCIVKYFLNEYYLKIRQGAITNKDEHARFFLKLLKSSANNYSVTIELKSRNEYKGSEFINNGKPNRPPSKNIFDNTNELKYLPVRDILDTLNADLLRNYKESQQKMEKLIQNDFKKNRIIAGLIVILIVIGIILIF